MGDVEHKSILQLLAASEAERDVIYCTFTNHPNLAENLEEVYNLIKDKTVGEVYKSFCAYEKLVSSGDTFFKFLKSYFGKN